jgi:anti-anti-sigma regulatory factor
MRGGTVPQEKRSATIDLDVLAEPPVVTVAGEIDEAATLELRTILIGLLSLGHAAVEVDLGRVERLEPGVHDAFSDVWSRGMVIYLCNPSPAVQELLHLEAS